MGGEKSNTFWKIYTPDYSKWSTSFSFTFATDSWKETCLILKKIIIKTVDANGSHSLHAMYFK